MEINRIRDPYEELLLLTGFGESNPYRQFMQALHQFQNIINRMRTCRMNDHKRHYLFGLAHHKIGIMKCNCKPALQRMRVALKDVYRVNTYRGTLIGPLQMSKEEMLVKVMSMLKDNQVGFLMDLAESRKNPSYQAKVDILEYCFPNFSKALS